MSVGKVARRLIKLEHYCYLRWQRATNREAELFWINKFGYIGDLLQKLREVKDEKTNNV